MALKGKTTFELTDVNTGEVEVIEDTNMITNGLQDFLATYGYFGVDVLSNDKMGASSLWVNVLGGLFLFDSRLEENVENTFMPAGVKMIGNGSKDMSNSGVVTELGSYNATESGLQSDGSIKLVYDFSTQQANGTIACACLTSKLGGYIGMGNESNFISDETNYKNYFETYSSDSKHICYSGIKGGTYQLGHLLYPVYNENVIYFTNPYNVSYNSNYASQYFKNTKKMQILKVRGCFVSVSVKSRNSFNQVIATYDIDVPQDIFDYLGTDTFYLYYHADIEGNIFFTYVKSSDSYLNTGASCYIMKIDREMNATTYKFTNNVGKKLYLSEKTVVFNGEYMWLYTSQSPYTIYGIKYSDSTQIIETGVSRNSRYPLYNMAKNLIGIYDKYNGSNTTINSMPSVYDVINRTNKKCNSGCEDDDMMNVPFIDKKGVYICTYKSTSTSNPEPNKFFLLKDPRYLATINNLSEPVVKTASKTMKVTYTITEA